MKARLSNSNISPKKMNLVAGMIRGKSIAAAKDTLKFANKKAAKILLKLLNSAVANAVNNFKQSEESLVIDEIKVGKGMTLKRFNPVSRGRAHKIKKVRSHVIITLKKVVAEKEVKKATTKTDKKTVAPSKKKVAKPKAAATK